MEDYFYSLRDAAFGNLQKGEHLFLNLASENSQFVRINSGQVRQIGTVEDAALDLTIITESSDGLRKTATGFTLSKNIELDRRNLKLALEKLQREVKEIPVDPYAELPKNSSSSSKKTTGKLLGHQEAVEKILRPLKNCDMAGIYASGSSVRAMANSAGQTHWFSNESFSFDYSFYTSSKRALKGTYAGKTWSQENYLHDIESAKEQILVLNAESVRLPKGSYRAYLAPAAVEDLVQMFSWGCLSEASIQQGDSPLRLLRSGEKSLSPLFSLTEDFTGVEVPHFNDLGELSNEKLEVISNGKLVNSLVNSRTSKEYKLPSNAANASETMRAPSVQPGSLEENKILEELGEGLYLSNLHYLNWSDQNLGRITGLTRYACFWVKNGKIVRPIENMRWDDNLFHFFGSELLELTKKTAYCANVGSYGFRNLGGAVVPGILLKSMEFNS